MKNIVGVHRDIPSILKDDIGHKNGVAKNAIECVGISINICKSQAKTDLIGFLNIIRNNKNTTIQIIILCVMLYKICT